MCELNSPFSSSREEEEVFSQNLTEAGREHAGPFLNAPIQILSYDGKKKLRWFRNLPSPDYQG
jgi:hypothetical protein